MASLLQTILDPYSLLHFATGIIAYYLGLSFWQWFVVHGLFELIENSGPGIKFINQHLGWFWPGGKDYQDPWENMLSDQVFALLGWALPRLLFGDCTKAPCSVFHHFMNNFNES